jgi:hypothetical protein
MEDFDTDYYNREEAIQRQGGAIQDPLFDQFETAFWKFKRDYYLYFMTNVKQQNADSPEDTVAVINQFINKFNNILNVLANRTFSAQNYFVSPSAQELETAVKAIPNNRIGEYRSLIAQFRTNIFNLDRAGKAVSL